MAEIYQDKFVLKHRNVDICTKLQKIKNVENQIKSLKTTEI